MRDQDILKDSRGETDIYGTVTFSIAGMLFNTIPLFTLL